MDVGSDGHIIWDISINKCLKLVGYFCQDEDSLQPPFTERNITCKQVVLKLVFKKKRKSRYMTLIPLCRPPKGDTNLGSSSNDSHNVYLQEKHSKWISYLRNMSVCLTIRKKCYYTADNGIFGIIKIYQDLN